MELPNQHGSGGSLLVIQQRSDYERAAVLSLDQIKVIRSNNEYTEGPSATRRAIVPPRVAPRPDKPHRQEEERTHQVIRVVTVNNNYEHRPVHPPPQTLSRSTSSGSNSSASSEQGLLGRSPPPRPGFGSAHRVVRTQPKAPDDALKKPNGVGPAPSSGHRFLCERCGKCKCSECTAPRTLPSCLACGGQCLCSAESAVEHGTCMCLVRGLFYHCSNDDQGDSCADGPCSLSRGHCCSRFLCMGLMSVLFPCLLCYPPARGCLAACQSCYDRACRPGCRCKNSNTVYCKLESWPPVGLDKPS